MGIEEGVVLVLVITGGVVSSSNRLGILHRKIYSQPSIAQADLEVFGDGVIVAKMKKRGLCPNPNQILCLVWRSQNPRPQKERRVLKSNGKEQCIWVDDYCNLSSPPLHWSWLIGEGVLFFKVVAE